MDLCVGCAGGIYPDCTGVRMNMLTVKPVASNQSMTSLEIAELVEKRHDNVKRTIESLVKQAVIQCPQIEDIKNHQNRDMQVYIFTGEQGKRDSIIVVAQLCPEFTARLVDRWHALEVQASANQIVLPNFLNPAEAARAWADEVEAKQHAIAQVESLKPKAQALDRLITTDGLFGVREAAKALKISQSQLTNFLVQHKWTFRTKSNRLEAYAHRIEQGVLTHVLTQPMPDNTGIDRVYHQLKVTAKGMAMIAGILEKEAAK